MALALNFEYFIYFIIFVALVIGSYTDFKKREVPDWLNYSLVVIGFSTRIIFAIGYRDWSYLIEGLFGFVACFILALIMFYAGQWGGGDAKLLMGLGAILGLQLNIDTFILGFVINTVICGAIFGLLFSCYLAIFNWKKFIKEFKILFTEKKKIKWIVWSSTLVILITAFAVPNFLKFSIILMGGLVFVSFYLYIYLKAIEKSAMLIYLNPSELTEGDWIVEDVVVGKKRICGPKDLGIEREQIEELIKLKKQKKIDKVLVKNGFPFVPSFFLAFIVSLVYGNIIFNLVFSIL